MKRPSKKKKVQQLSLAIIFLIALNTLAGCMGGGSPTAQRGKSTALFTSNNCMKGGISATNVLTQHNDAARTGADLTETQLTPDCVSTQFGKAYTISLQGQV